MSEEANLKFGEARTRRGESGDSPAGNGNGTRQEYRSQAGSGYGRLLIGSRAEPAAHQPHDSRPFNIWRILEILTRRWSWIAIGAGVFGLLAFIIALSITRYSVGVTLFRNPVQNAFTGGMDPSQSKELALITLYRLMGSPEVIHRVAMKSTEYPITPGQLAKSVRISPERDPEFVTISVSGKQSKTALAYWANLYGKEIIDYMREVQSNEAAFANDALKNRLKSIQADLEPIGKNMAAFTTEANVVDFDRAVDAFVQQVFSVEIKFDEAKLNLETTQMKISALEAELQRQSGSIDQLQAEEQKLEALFQDYKDKHPFVIRQREIIENLKRKSTLTSTNLLGTGQLPATSLGNAIYLQLIDLGADRQRLEKQVKHFEQLKETVQTQAKGLSQKNTEFGLLKARYKSLETLRNSYEDKQRHAQMLQESGLGYFRLFSNATPEQANVRKRWITVLLLAIVGGMIGAMTAALASVIAEAADGRIKTADDLRRISRVPLLATLGDLRGMVPSEQVAWAFRTLTILQGKLNTATDQTLVCGFISSQHGEGRSTWINLLTSAASQRGLRVLTVATRPANATEAREPAPVAGLLPVQPSTTLTTNVLMVPGQVTEQFSDPKAQPIVHIPLPGWVWNLERRKQWSIALEQWSKIENLVLLVELPPATEPESVLLAEHLPLVIWLACSGRPGATETMHQIETLRHARVNLVGAVLNREPSSIVKTRFASWLRGFAAVALSFSLGSAGAVVPEQASAEPAALVSQSRTNLSFSVSASTRASWQQRLTHGPGDALDFAFLGKPELARTNIVVDPNGRINYLQLQDFPAAGLTVDELRGKADQALSDFYRTPRVMITPAAFNSKKYFMLGKVAGKGVYILDRPLTIIEAVARAKGLETGLIGPNTVDTADLSRSFLVRNGQKIDLDLERLFHEGDLTQNIALEPNDYVYFAPNSMNEVYVLGEVLSPGVAPYTSRTGLIAALASRGGFTQRAYRKKVLVIRGSLNHPESFVVDSAATLRGRTPDFKLEPRDIVYVNARPWIKVEELIDMGIQSFIEGAVIGWTAGNIGPILRRPILPQL